MSTAQSALRWRDLGSMSALNGGERREPDPHPAGALTASSVTEASLARIQDAIDAMAKVLQSTFGDDPPGYEPPEQESLDAQVGPVTEW